jgi:hypothetical protein
MQFNKKNLSGCRIWITPLIGHTLLWNITMFKKKANPSLHFIHVLRAILPPYFITTYKETEVELHLFLALALSGDERRNWIHQLIYQCPMDRKMCGPYRRRGGSQGLLGIKCLLHSVITHNKVTVLRYTGFCLGSGNLKMYRILKNEAEYKRKIKWSYLHVSMTEDIRLLKVAIL